MSYYIIAAILIIIGYLFGSICSAVIISRAFNLPDPSAEGSKNPGATNVLRLSGKKYALAVVIVDVLKGTIPVLIAKCFPVSELVVTYTCLAAVLGHMFPIFFSFKGGKGVATAIGGLLGLQFILGCMVVAIWLLVAQITRYSSLASLLSMTAMPLLALWTTENVTFFTPLFFITLFIYYKHRDNITRLLDGEESKITFSSALINTKPSALEPEEEAAKSQPETKATPAKKATTAKKPATAKKAATTKKTSTPKQTTKKSTAKSAEKATAKSTTKPASKTAKKPAKQAGSTKVKKKKSDEAEAKQQKDEKK